MVDWRRRTACFISRCVVSVGVKLTLNPSRWYERGVGLASLTAAYACGTVFGLTSSTVSNVLMSRNRRASRLVKSECKNGKRCLGLSRVLMCLIVSVGVAAVMCWIQQCTIGKAAPRKHETAVSLGIASSVAIRGVGYAFFSNVFRKVGADRIRCIAGRRSPLLCCVLMILVAVALAINPRVYSNVSARLLPSISRGSPHVESTQAYAPLWHIHEANVVFQAVIHGRNCRNGVGKKKRWWDGGQQP